MKKYKESPIFYMGNKYKLLKDIIPLFPNECDVFIDGFGGSGVVSINYKGKNRTIYNEYNPNIYNLVKIFKDNNYNTLDNYIQNVIDKYDLKTGKKRNMFDSEEAFLDDTNAKKIRYNKFRTQYNESLRGGQNYLNLYILSIFSCNHLIRFNTKDEFNASFGSNGDYNDNLKNKIKNGIEGLKEVELSNKDFFNLDLSILSKDSFVYVDPPYLNTTAVYNEKRAYGGWDIDSDYKLFKTLEELNKKGIKWGFSNVFVNRGISNEHLIKWCNDNNWNVFHLKRNYNPFSRGNSNNDEVYICNYEVSLCE